MTIHVGQRRDCADLNIESIPPVLRFCGFYHQAAMSDWSGHQEMNTMKLPYIKTLAFLYQKKKREKKEKGLFRLRMFNSIRANETYVSGIYHVLYAREPTGNGLRVDNTHCHVAFLWVDHKQLVTSHARWYLKCAMFRTRRWSRAYWAFHARAHARTHHS